MLYEIKICSCKSNLRNLTSRINTSFSGISNCKLETRSRKHLRILPRYERGAGIAQSV
jgi:hypothetical protein